MIKKFTCLGCVTLGLVSLSACGVTTPISVDQTTIWTGGLNATNQVSTQGYWWTYVDHDGYDVTHGATQYEQGANITPLTDINTPLKLEDDPVLGKIVRVHGFIPQAFSYNSTPPAPSDETTQTQDTSCIHRRLVDWAHAAD